MPAAARRTTARTRGALLLVLTLLLLRRRCRALLLFLQLLLGCRAVHTWLHRQRGNAAACAGPACIWCLAHLVRVRHQSCWRAAAVCSSPVLFLLFGVFAGLQVSTAASCRRDEERSCR